MVVATSAVEITEAITQIDEAGEPLLVLGGGSNLVVADVGFPGTVVRIASRGCDVIEHGDQAELVVAAGEPWDDLVARAIDDGLRGIECLSGIPGSTGATPIQNVGAYGASVDDVISRVRVWDRTERRVVDLMPAECGFAYRTSRFKHSERFVVLEVAFTLARARTSAPIRYAELARMLGVAVGERVPLVAVREAVLDLRRAKGMLIDPHDPASVSAGSFFTNPILDARSFARFEQAVAGQLGSDVRPPAWPEANGCTKTSAAWLIERAGFSRGYGEGLVGLSTKHTLALINRGGATTAELVALAREIRSGVVDTFGVELHPEPTLVGVEL